MPRPASKAKSNKPKQRLAVKETTPTESEQKMGYIIPGRLSRPHWNDMLIQEETDEIVGEIMDELLGNVTDRCHKLDIERQLIPYTVFWAGEYLTQTVEQQFLYLDEREGPEQEICRTEDPEPTPAAPDSWAEGCVPVVKASNQTHCTSPQISLLQKLDNDQVPVQTEPRVKKKVNAFALTNRPVQQAEREAWPRKAFIGPPCAEPCPRSPVKTNQKKEQANIHPKMVPVKTLSSTSSSVKKMCDEIKSDKREDPAFKGRPTSAQHLQNCQPVPKLDPSRLPQRYIVPEYEILDDIKPNPQKPGGLLRLEPTLNKCQTERIINSSLSSKDQPQTSPEGSEHGVCMSRSKKQQRGLSGPRRLDMNILAKGVSLLDVQDVESSPVKPSSPPASTQMKPIRSDAAVPMFSVDQVTAGPAPRVLPPSQSKNCDRDDFK